MFSSVTLLNGYARVLCNYNSSNVSTFRENGSQNRSTTPPFKGKWVHPEIDNPEYVEDKELYKYSDFGAIGFDLWQVITLKFM